jgi:cystathionine beta-synthase
MAGLVQMKNRFSKDDVVVVIFHDHGTRYLGKMFNDEWMRDRGFLAKDEKTAKDLVAAHRDLKLVTLSPGELVSHAIGKMKKFSISQIPVVDDGKFVGAIDENLLFNLMVENPAILDARVDAVMKPPFPVVKEETPLHEVSKLITREIPAVVVELGTGGHHIVTRHDVISAI